MKKILNLTFIFLFVLTMSLGPSLSTKTARASNDYPTWIYAPSISLFSPVQGMGLTKNGELDVPSGLTNNVGWYKNGVVPGSTGTAVLDAHVFAAFKNLNQIQAGGHIYLLMASGKFLDYVVTASNLYPIKNLSPYTLFTPTASKQLNLITCAGKYISSVGTYDHRLIVSAKLV